jgi:hypothetical protein
MEKITKGVIMKTLMKVIKREFPAGADYPFDSEIKYTSDTKNFDEQMKFFKSDKRTFVYCVEFNEDGTTKKIKVNKVFCRSHDLYKHEVMSFGYEF